MSTAVSPSVDPRFVVAIAAYLRPRLHRAAQGRRCRCGACAHQIRMAAACAGIPAPVLAETIGATPADPAAAGRRRRQPRPLHAPIATSATVTMGQARHTGTCGVAAMFTALRHRH